MFTIKDAVDRLCEQFEDVEVGDTFRRCDNCESIFIKVKPVKDREGSQWDAVCLADGQFAHFRNESYVELTEIEATVLERKS